MKNLFSYLLILIPFLGLCQMNKKHTDKWIDKNESEDYTARHECSFVQIGDKFVLFGGRESAQKLDIYDYKNNTWSTGRMAPKEFNHFQATAYEGFIWVIAAFKTNNFPREIPEEHVWLYHPPTDNWIQGPEIPENRRRGGAGLVMYKDKFYVVGGNTIGHDGGYVNWFDEYDPKANTWTVLENASQQRDHFSAAVIDNKLYAAGGRQSGGEGGVFAPLPAIVDTYDFEVKRWSVLSENLPTPRAAPGIVVYNGELFVMGGEGEEAGPAYKLVEAYNPKSGLWSKKENMNYARHGTQAILSGNGIHIAAGSPVQAGGNQRNMEVYGEDNPKGKALVGSKLSAKSEVEIPIGTETTINLKNTGGNTGCFISTIALTGDARNQYQIESKVEHILVSTGEEMPIVIKHIGKSTNQQAGLKIVYNGNQVIEIKLKSK